MAQRRMFSQRIVESARFLKMPPSTQALYFHLGLHADDDGVVEGYNVMMQTGATEDDLRILSAKGFITVLNTDLVTYINDWKENNKIRADRKVDTIYKDLLVKMLPNIEIQQAKARADTGKKTGEKAATKPLLSESTQVKNMDNQWTSNGQRRLGKDRLGKDSKDIYSQAKARQPYHDDYEEIISYLNEKLGGGHYRPTTKSTQQKIKARFKEGFTVDDFKTVIDKKTAEWLHDDKMANYLRPETLFGTKFEGYLNQKNVGKVVNGHFKKVEKGTDWRKKEQELKKKKAKEKDKITDPFVKSEKAEKLRNFFKNLENETGG